MQEINNREDIFLLVTTFYKNIRKDELLGPIFNQHIEENKWPEHLEKLTDFWATNLLGVACFKGNPLQAHIKVDKKSNYTIEPNHFGQWLNLWFSTIDSLYEGDVAYLAKYKARKMAASQYIGIWKNRPDNKVCEM